MVASTQDSSQYLPSCVSNFHIESELAFVSNSMGELIVCDSQTRL